jgi:hypothetical protein
MLARNSHSAGSDATAKPLFTSQPRRHAMTAAVGHGQPTGRRCLPKKHADEANFASKIYNFMWGHFTEYAHAADHQLIARHHDDAETQNSNNYRHDTYFTAKEIRHEPVPQKTPIGHHRRQPPQ